MTARSRTQPVCESEVLGCVVARGPPGESARSAAFRSRETAVAEIPSLGSARASDDQRISPDHARGANRHSQGMNAAPIAPTHGSADDVISWRREQLRAAGYGWAEACRLAERTDVDLHLATDLLRNGCTSETALRILL